MNHQFKTQTHKNLSENITSFFFQFYKINVALFETILIDNWKNLSMCSILREKFRRNWLCRVKSSKVTFNINDVKSLEKNQSFLTKMSCGYMDSISQVSGFMFLYFTSLYCLKCHLNNTLVDLGWTVVIIQGALVFFDFVLHFSSEVQIFTIF